MQGNTPLIIDTEGQQPEVSTVLREAHQNPKLRRISKIRPLIRDLKQEIRGLEAEIESLMDNRETLKQAEGGGHKSSLGRERASERKASLEEIKRDLVEKRSLKTLKKNELNNLLEEKERLELSLKQERQEGISASHAETKRVAEVTAAPIRTYVAVTLEEANSSETFTTELLGFEHAKLPSLSELKFKLDTLPEEQRRHLPNTARLLKAFLKALPDPAEEDLASARSFNGKTEACNFLYAFERGGKTFHPAIEALGFELQNCRPSQITKTWMEKRAAKGGQSVVKTLNQDIKLEDHSEELKRVRAHLRSVIDIIEASIGTVSVAPKKKKEKAPLEKKKDDPDLLIQDQKPSVAIPSTEDVRGLVELASLEEIWKTQDRLSINLPGFEEVHLPHPQVLWDSLQDNPPAKKAFPLSLIKILASYHRALPRGKDLTEAKRFNGRQTHIIFIGSSSAQLEWARVLDFQFGEEHRLRPIDVFKVFFEKYGNGGKKVRLKDQSLTEDRQDELQRAHIALVALVTVLESYTNGAKEISNFNLSGQLTASQTEMLLSPGERKTFEAARRVEEKILDPEAPKQEEFPTIFTPKLSESNEADSPAPQSIETEEAGSPDVNPNPRTGEQAPTGLALEGLEAMFASGELHTDLTLDLVAPADALEQIERLKEEEKALIARVQEIQQAIKVCESEIEEYRKELKNLPAEKETLSQSIKQKRLEAQGKSTERGRISGTSAKHEARKATEILEREARNLEKELKAIVKRKTQAQEGLPVSRGQLKRLQQELTQTEDKQLDLAVEIESLQTAVRATLASAERMRIQMSPTGLQALVRTVVESTIINVGSPSSSPSAAVNPSNIAEAIKQPEVLDVLKEAARGTIQSLLAEQRQIALEAFEADLANREEAALARIQALHANLGSLLQSSSKGSKR